MCIRDRCTGGLLGKLLTDVPGASSVYKGGVISYVNEIKHRLLGVDQQTLDVCTAVSRETAHEMAKGAREVVPVSYTHLDVYKSQVRSR